MAEFNEKLKALRIKKGFATAKEFALFSGIPINTYTSYEKNTEPKLNSILTIAKALKISTDELLGVKSDLNKSSDFEYFKKLIEENTEYRVVNFMSGDSKAGLALVREADKDKLNTKEFFLNGKWSYFSDKAHFCKDTELRIKVLLHAHPEIFEFCNGFRFVFDDEQPNGGSN